MPRKVAMRINLLAMASCPCTSPAMQALHVNPPIRVKAGVLKTLHVRAHVLLTDLSCFFLELV